MRNVDEDTNLRKYIHTSKQGHIGIVEKYRKQARILVYITLCMCTITVLHERWMQDTPTTHCVTWFLGKYIGHSNA